jgi:exosortase
MIPNSTAPLPEESLPAEPGASQAGSASGLSRWTLGLIAFGFAPPFIEFLANIWNLPPYQFFPGALVGAGILARDRIKEVPRPLNPGLPWVTIPVILISFLALAVAVLLWSPWLGTVSAVICLIAMLWWGGGWPLLRNMIPAIIMIATIIPPPFGLDNELTLHLRSIATAASSRFLDFLHVVHCVSGNVIELPRQKLLVEEACSGINSVLFTSAFAIFYLLWRRRSFWCYLICLPAAIGFVVMGNVVRITLGAWSQYRLQIDLLSGWKHETIGLILVAIYIVLVMSLEHLLYWPKFVKEDLRGFAGSYLKEADEPAPVRLPQVSRRISPTWGLVAGILFSILGLAGIASCYSFHRASEGLAAKSALSQGAKFDLPEQIGVWKQLTTGGPALKKIETLGLSSMIWTFVSPSKTIASVAFDYPIWGYHDVTLCYTTNGWDIFKRERMEKDANTPPWLEMEMRHHAEGYGNLWVSNINEHGQWMEVAQVKRSFLDRVSRTVSGLGGAEETSYRVQVLVTTPLPISTQNREEVAQLFQQARTLLVRQLLGQIDTKKSTP